MYPILLFISALFAALAFYNFYWKRRNLPPGPAPLPLLGNLLAIKNSGTGELQFREWRKKYGPIYTYWIAELPVVCVAEYGLMVELFKANGDNFAQRYNLPFEATLSDGKILAHGILISSGERWKEQRKFAFQVLKDFGLGKNLMQNRILLELGGMFAKIDSQLEEGGGGSGEVDLPDLMEIAIGSIINGILFGYGFEGEREADFWELKGLLDEHLREYGGHSLFWMYMFWPNLLKNVPWFRTKRELLEERIRRFHVYFEKRILARQSQINLDNLETPSTDYVEAFLKEKARREADKESGHHFTMYQLGMMCFDLYVTGQETTATVLSWAFALLLNNPDCLGRVQAELDSVIGPSGGLITVAERPKLPYTNAAINEILRVANIAPHNFLRKVGEDVRLGNGTWLRKGTCISPQISVLLCDEDIFPEPELFNPGRFLDEQGQFRGCEQLQPFSIGRRQCLGEALARMELFLFITNILHRYEVILLPFYNRNGKDWRVSHLRYQAVCEGFALAEENPRGCGPLLAIQLQNAETANNK